MLGDRTLQPEKQPSVGRARIIDTIVVSDQTATQTQISRRGSQSVQLRAKPLTSIDRKRSISLRPTRPTSLLKPSRWEIGVNHVDGCLTPSELAGALAELAMKAQALLIAYDLVGYRLADVDYGFARQVVWCDQLGLHEASQPKSRRRLPRSGVGARASAATKDRLDPCSCASGQSAVDKSSSRASILSLI